MTVTTYHVPREEQLEGLGPFTVTDPNPDATFQVQIHAYGVRPTAPLWFDSETINSVAGCVGVGTSSAHWAALTRGKYRISVRDKEQPSFERVGVATLYIT